MKNSVGLPKKIARFPIKSRMTLRGFGNDNTAHSVIPAKAGIYFRIGKNRMDRI